MKAILTCVDYGDILSLTLPYNRHHFTDVMIVTSPHDEETITIAKANDCQLHITPDFYKDNAAFNKWIPLEQGLDALGRTGFICIMDADIAWPKEIDMPTLNSETIYSPRRYINENLFLPEEHKWKQYPIHAAAKYFAGYTQIFYAESRCLNTRPWHPSHHHAGGPDTVFQNKFPLKKRLPFTVFHIGPTETNWGGRSTPKMDGSVVPGSELRKANINNIIRDHNKTFREHL